MRLFRTILIALSLLCIASCNSIKVNTKYAWVLGTASPENTVTGIFANSFASYVEELSDGQMKIKVYHNSLLGGDTELIESCQCGDIPFVVQNTAPEVSYMPRLCLFDLPCLFDSLETLHRVLDDEGFLSKVNSIYEDAGFHLLSMADQNFRVMTSNKKIGSMSDFKGVKIRTMENSYHMDFWSAVGANPTPMAFAELYVGLEQHTVDAQENPYEVICSNGFYEVQDYVIETNHLPHLLALVVSNDFMKTLSDKERDVVERAAALARDDARVQAKLRNDSRIEEIIKGGSEIVSLDGELRDQMRAASEALYKKIRAKVGDDALVNYYMGIK